MEGFVHTPIIRRFVGQVRNDNAYFNLLLAFSVRKKGAAAGAGIMLHRAGGQTSRRHIGHMGQLMGMILCRLKDKATVLTGLRGGLRCLRTGNMILGITVGAAGLAKMGMVQIATGGPLGGIGGYGFP